MTEPRYIRVRAYCEKYGFVPRTVYGWVKQGKLPFIIKGRSVRVLDQTDESRPKQPSASGGP